MSRLKTDTFYTHDAEPLWQSIQGPVESFTVQDEKLLLEHAIKEGEIPPGAFQNCAIFSDSPEAEEQKRLRYEGKRALGILEILSEAKQGEPSLDDLSASLYAHQTMARAVLVEAARKSDIERTNGSLSSRHEQLYDTALDTAQAELFPRPNRIVADYAMSSVLEMARNINGAQAERLAAEYPFLAVESSEHNVLLSPEKRAEWHAMLHEKYDPLFAEVRAEIGENGLSNATLPHVVQLFMEKVGLPMKTKETEGWECVPRDNIAGFRVDPNELRVNCGRRKNEITWPIFERLMMHEIVVHAMRAENGRQLGYAAAQNGFPNNQEFEEGLGILIESLWNATELDKVSRDHFRYLAVCYSDGFLDGEKHDETESLRFVSRLIASQKPNGLEDETILSSARGTGFDHVKRAFRGMPDEKRMYSNLAYLAGKLEAIRFIGQSRLPAAELLEYLQQGKFNPIYEDQDTLIRRMGRAA